MHSEDLRGQASALLRRCGRVSYRTLRLRFSLNDMEYVRDGCCWRIGTGLFSMSGGWGFDGGGILIPGDSNRVV